MAFDAATVDDAVTTAREQSTRQGIQYETIQRVDPTTFEVEGVEPARVKDMRDVLRDYFRDGWEVREAGEGRFLVQMTDMYQAQLADRTVEEAKRTLERRVNQLGVAEPVIALAVVQAAGLLPSTVGFVLVLGVHHAVRVARLLRGESLRLLSEPYVMAARNAAISSVSVAM